MIFFSFTFINAVEFTNLDKDVKFDEIPNHFIDSSKIDKLTDNWKINNSELVVYDFEEDVGGSLIYIFNDTKYKSNYSVSVDIYREKYSSDWDSQGIIIGYDKGSYWSFDTSNYQGWFSYKTSKTTNSISHSNYWGEFKNIPLEELNSTHKLRINVYDDKIHLFFNDIFLYEISNGIREGYIGLYVWDSSSKNTNFYSKTFFDNFKVYKTPEIETSLEKDEYIINVNSTKNIKEIEFVVEEHINNSGYDNNIIIDQIYSNKTTFNEKDNITMIEIFNDYVYDKEEKPNVVLKIYYLVKDWVGGIFKSNDI